MMWKPAAWIANLHRRILKAWLRTVCAPFLHLYARNFFAGVALLVFTIMALVEAVFLAERFPMVFREVFRHHADPLDTTLLFLCNSTQVFDLALAIAILMAVYWTTLRMRENRELLVLFAAGTGPYRLLALVLVIAVAAQIGSLTISGVLDPAARYAQRVILFNAEFRALRSGINTGQFYSFPGRVAFAPARPAERDRAEPERTRGLFVYEDLKPGKFRVITADHARLDGPDASGKVVLRLGGLTALTFSDEPPAAGAGPAPAKTGAVACTDCPVQPSGVPRMTLSASDVVQEMASDQLLTFMPRGSKSEEMTIFEQFAATSDSSSLRHREDMRLLGGRLARSFLCLLAPLVALACICFTTRATHYFALPIACMGLMSLNVTSEWLVRVTVPLNPLGALSVPAALTAVFAALLLTEIFREQGMLARPQLARS
ncbi:MAG TPA: LptF/LptG family permease [Rhizomicrobium sp.]